MSSRRFYAATVSFLHTERSFGIIFEVVDISEQQISQTNFLLDLRLRRLLVHRVQMGKISSQVICSLN